MSITRLFQGKGGISLPSFGPKGVGEGADPGVSGPGVDARLSPRSEESRRDGAWMESGGDRVARRWRRGDEEVESMMDRVEVKRWRLGRKSMVGWAVGVVVVVVFQRVDVL